MTPGAPEAETSQMGFGMAAFLKLSSFIVAVGLAIGIGLWIPEGLPPALALFTAILLSIISFVASIPIVSVFLVASRTAPDGLPRLYVFLERLAWWKGLGLSLAIGLLLGACIGLVTHPTPAFDSSPT